MQYMKWCNCSPHQKYWNDVTRNYGVYTFTNPCFAIIYIFERNIRIKNKFFWRCGEAQVIRGGAHVTRDNNVDWIPYYTKLINHLIKKPPSLSFLIKWSLFSCIINFMIPNFMILYIVKYNKFHDSYNLGIG